MLKKVLRIELRAILLPPPRNFGSRGTPLNLFCTPIKSICAKFGACTRLVTIISMSDGRLQRKPVNPTHFYTLQVQSFTEYFQSDCSDPIAWLNAPNYFTAITEGWAAYNEYELFPNETTLYTPMSDKEIKRQKYGMLYYQVRYHRL